MAISSIVCEDNNNTSRKQQQHSQYLVKIICSFCSFNGMSCSVKLPKYGAIGPSRKLLFIYTIEIFFSQKTLENILIHPILPVLRANRQFPVKIPNLVKSYIWSNHKYKTLVKSYGDDAIETRTPRNNFKNINSTDLTFSIQ